MRRLAFEAWQGFAVLRGFQPEGELGNFDAFGVQVDAVEVAVENFAVDVEEVRVARDRLDLLVDAAVLGVEDVEGGDEKCARSARGIDYAHLLQTFAPCIPEKELDQPVGRLKFCLLPVRGGLSLAGIEGDFVSRRLAPFTRCITEAAAQCRLLPGEIRAQGFIDDETGDRVGRVDDAVLLALAADRAGAVPHLRFERGERQCIVVRQGLELFQVADRLLEDVAEHGDRNILGEIVLAEG